MELYDKKTIEEMIISTKRQLEIARINERYYQRAVLKGNNKMATQLLAQEQGKVQGFTDFLTYLEEINKE